MRRVYGLTGEEACPQLDDAAKQRLLGCIGETIAEVQRVPLGALVALDPQWDALIEQQITGGHALPKHLLVGLDDYIREAAPLIPRGVSPVILTGEYVPENFIMRDGALAALIDFGDVMTGTAGPPSRPAARRRLRDARRSPSALPHGAQARQGFSTGDDGLQAEYCFLIVNSPENGRCADTIGAMMD